MNGQKKKRSLTLKKLLLDLALFAFAALVSIPEVTGIAFHEWIGITFAVPVVAHLLLNWKWIVNVTKRFFSRLPRQARAKLIVNLLLFFTVLLVSFSGMLISESMLPAMGVTVSENDMWEDLHELSANLFLIVTGVHLVMHRGWIKRALRKYRWHKPVTQTKPMSPTLGD